MCWCTENLYFRNVHTNFSLCGTSNFYILCFPHLLGADTTPNTIKMLSPQANGCPVVKEKEEDRSDACASVAQHIAPVGPTTAQSLPLPHCRTLPQLMCTTRIMNISISGHLCFHISFRNNLWHCTVYILRIAIIRNAVYSLQIFVFWYYLACTDIDNTAVHPEWGTLGLAAKNMG